MTDAEEPTPGERREVDGLLREARRAIDPPRVVTALEVAIADVLGEHFDVVDPGEITGTTWTAQELAESIEARLER